MWGPPCKHDPQLVRCPPRSTATLPCCGRCLSERKRHALRPRAAADPCATTPPTHCCPSAGCSARSYRPHEGALGEASGDISLSLGRGASPSCWRASRCSRLRGGWRAETGEWNYGDATPIVPLVGASCLTDGA